MTRDLVPEIEPYMTDDVPLDDVRENALRPLIYLCLFFTVILVAMGFVIRVPEYVKARFVLQGNVPEVEYQFPETVYVEELMVAAGQSVATGADLVRITSPDIVKRIASLREAEQQLERFRAEQYEIHQSRLNQKELELAQVREQLAEDRRSLDSEQDAYGERVEALQFDLSEAERQVEQNRELVDQGFVSKNRFVELQQTVNRAKERLAETRQHHENEVNRLESNIRKLELDMDMHRLELDQLVRTYNQEEQKIVSHRDQVLESIRHQYRQAVIVDGSLKLQSPMSGTVSFLRSGERTVPAEETLVKIMGREEGLHAVAILDMAGMGRLATNQRVILKLDSFPHYRFGVATGKVSSVSLSPDQDGRLPFIVDIADEGQLSGRLRTGMTGQLSVIVAEQRFFGMLFNKVQQQLDN